MARYAIQWSVVGEFECDASSSGEAQQRFAEEWLVGAIQPRRDGVMSSRRPVELFVRCEGCDGHECIHECAYPKQPAST